MKKFMGEDFLLETAAAKELYHNYAAKMPIIDYHCHIDPADIALDKKYKNITEIWLGGDHYKWRAMRCNGIQEKDITGAKDTDPYKTFECWAQTLPRCIGNPLYHWTYLELKKYFGIEKLLNEKTAKEIYDACNKRLADQDMSVRGIINQSAVKLICTTDDPLDDLVYHKQISEDKTCNVKVLPAFRPDKSMNIDKPGFKEYISRLEEVTTLKIQSFSELKQALFSRLEYFKSYGCRASDHALDEMIFAEATEEELDHILIEGLATDSSLSISKSKADKFKTAILLALAEKYYQYDWVMQIHYGCLRNNSDTMFNKLGADTGFDSAADSGGAAALAALLNGMESRGHLPKMIFYSLNQYDNEIIASVAGGFQTDSKCPSRIQLGSAWWFNDHKSGMLKQLTDLANLGVLGNFVGMLTDSRSFLSYTRHEYFRRILCNLIGGWIENGELPADMETIGGIIEDICYNNAAAFFGFKEILGD